MFYHARARIVRVTPHAVLEEMKWHAPMPQVDVERIIAKRYVVTGKVWFKDGWLHVGVVGRRGQE